MTRTLVIVPGSERKRHDVPDPARAADLDVPTHRQRAEARLAAFAHPASEMYTSTHHQLVMRGLAAVRKRWASQVLDLAILSAGYGLVHGDERIVPYDTNIVEMDELEFAEWTRRHQIPEQVASMARDYELIFLLLSGRHLLSVGLPLPDPTHQIVLTDQAGLALVPPPPKSCGVLADGGAAAQRWHVKAAQVRGFLFERLCRQIVHHGPIILDWLCHQPQDTELLFYKHPRWRPQRSFW
jgi:hypothetical protein